MLALVAVLAWAASMVAMRPRMPGRASARSSTIIEYRSEPLPFGETYRKMTERPVTAFGERHTRRSNIADQQTRNRKCIFPQTPIDPNFVLYH
nr:MAG TPA: hypothetical protein [Caudoviricetes sp.]